MTKTIAAIFFFLAFAYRAVAAPQAAQPVQPGPQDLTKLIQALKSKDFGTRMDAAERLAKMGDRAAKAIPALIEMLSDTEKFYFDGIVDGKMTGGSRSGGDAASDALAAIGKPSIGPLVAALEAHKNALIRWGAAVTLGKINDPASVDPLIKALSDKDKSVKGAAVWALGRLKDRRAVAPLKALLDKETDSYIRQAAEDAIQSILK